MNEVNLFTVTAEAGPLQCRLRGQMEGDAAPRTIHEWTVAAGDTCRVGIGGGTWLEVREVTN